MTSERVCYVPHIMNTLLQKAHKRVCHVPHIMNTILQKAHGQETQDQDLRFLCNYTTKVLELRTWSKSMNDLPSTHLIPLQRVYIKCFKIDIISFNSLVMVKI